MATNNLLTNGDGQKLINGNNYGEDLTMKTANHFIQTASTTSPTIIYIQQPISTNNVTPTSGVNPNLHTNIVQASAVTPVNPGPKKRKKGVNGYIPKRIKVDPTLPHPEGSKKNALPSTTTLENASTETEQRAIKNSFVTPDGRHVCGECGNTLATSWGLDAHIKSVHGKKAFQCDFCDKAFGRKDHLVNHTKSMHTGTKECSQCGFVCSGKEGLTKHIADNHPIIPTMFHQCSECGRNYPTESACKIHIQQEHTMVTCQDCGNLCVGTEGLKKHVAKEHSNVVQQLGNTVIAAAAAPAAASASVAPVAVATSSAVTTQSVQPVSAAAPGGANVSGGKGNRFQIEVVFKCEFCSGTFSQQTSLDQHIKSFHMDLQCVACGSSLVGSQAMVTHIQESHQASKVMFNTGEICYHCEICESTFDKGHLYDDHFLQNHVYCRVGNELVKPQLVSSPPTATLPQHPLPLKPEQLQPQPPVNVVYQCAHCDSLFSDQSLLTKHMDSTHPETFALPTEPLPPSILAEFQNPLEPKKPKLEEQVFFQCLVCEQLFMEATTLHAHMDEHHNKNKTNIKKEKINNAISTATTTVVAAPTSGSLSGLNVLYECQHCNNLFQDKPSLDSHVSSEHIKQDKMLPSSSASDNFDSGFSLMLGQGSENHTTNSGSTGISSL